MQTKTLMTVDGGLLMMAFLLGIVLLVLASWKFVKVLRMPVPENYGRVSPTVVSAMIVELIMLALVIPIGGLMAWYAAHELYLIAH